MRHLAVLVAVVFGLTACARPDGTGQATYQSPRQQPSATEPGVQISGYANVGVKRRF